MWTEHRGNENGAPKTQEQGAAESIKPDTQETATVRNAGRAGVQSVPGRALPTLVF